MGSSTCPSKKVRGKCRGVVDCCCEKKIDERVRYYAPQLALFRSSDPYTRQQLLKTAPSCFVRLVCETGLNVLAGTLQLQRRHYKYLKPYKKLLTQLSDRSMSLAAKKTLLIKKKGGFLPVVIPYLLTALSGFAGQALAKAAF